MCGNAQYKSEQESLLQLLRARGLEPELVDGADPVNKDLRSAMFACSGRRAVYPQVFRRPRASTTPTEGLEFVGGYAEIFMANENEDVDGTLGLLLRGAAATPVAPMAAPATAASTPGVFLSPAPARHASKGASPGVSPQSRRMSVRPALPPSPLNAGALAPSTSATSPGSGVASEAHSGASHYAAPPLSPTSSTSSGHSAHTQRRMSTLSPLTRVTPVPATATSAGPVSIEGGAASGIGASDGEGGGGEGGGGDGDGAEDEGTLLATEAAEAAGLAVVADEDAIWNEWAEYEDDDGTRYWHNPITGESQWTRPLRRGEEVKPADAWAEFFDDEGTPYFFNFLTQETTWERPAALASVQ